MDMLEVPSLLVLPGAPIPGVVIGPPFPLIVTTATTGAFGGQLLER
jgi:hypothetical protein